MKLTGTITGIYKDYMNFEYKTEGGILTLELPINKNYCVDDEVTIYLEYETKL